jgi:predicted SAM-dependent methyltransferase
MEEIVNNAKIEFENYLKKWTIENNRFSNGIDVGCGGGSEATSGGRIDNMIVSIDQQPDWRYASAQFVWNCHDLDLFADGKLDFIFSSHCLEDFEDIPIVFKNWLRKVKIGGILLLLLPDMERCDCQFCNGRSRYASIEDFKATGKGNPSHRTNVGKQFMTAMLDDLYSKDEAKCKIEQMDTIPHNVSCSIDFVIRRIG